MFERIALGATRRRTVQLKPGHYDAGGDGIHLKRPMWVEEVEVYHYEHAVIKRGSLGWHHQRYDWDTAKPVQPEARAMTYAKRVHVPERLPQLSVARAPWWIRLLRGLRILPRQHALPPAIVHQEGERDVERSAP